MQHIPFVRCCFCKRCTPSSNTIHRVSQHWPPLFGAGFPPKSIQCFFWQYWKKQINNIPNKNVWPNPIMVKHTRIISFWADFGWSPICVEPQGPGNAAAGTFPRFPPPLVRETLKKTGWNHGEKTKGIGQKGINSPSL